MIEYLRNIDLSLFLLINGWNSSFFDYFFLIITMFGTGWVLAPFLTIIVMVKIRHKKVKNVLLAGILGMTISGVVNNQIKIITAKPRPVKYFAKYNNEVVKSNKFDLSKKIKVHTAGPIHKNKSFPSGHTCSAFAAATFLAILFKKWWYLSFVIALLVGYSRIYLGQHFPSDVLAGAIVGIFIMGAIIKISGNRIDISADDGEVK